MTRRQWKSAFWVLSGALALLLIMGAYFYRNDLFTYSQDPAVPFQTYTPPATPDYATSEAWIMRPEADFDLFDDSRPADVFVLTPTLHTGRNGWNAPIFNERFREKTNNRITPNYVSPYLSVGRVYAPYYRHAALYAFLTNRDDARYAQNFAYEDAALAFETFLSESLPERPIILIGHGQGGLHLPRLIEDFITDDIRPRIAGIYIIDHPLPINDLPADFTACENADQTGCIVSFSSFTDDDEALAVRAETQTLVYSQGELEPVAGRPVLCTNPLLWTVSNDYAPARLHKGGIAAEGLTPDIAVAPSARQFGAQCVDGVLIIDKPKRSALRRDRGFGNAFITPAFNLFSEDLRLNMHERVNALIASEAVPRRAPSIIEEEIIDISDAPITPDN